MENLEEYESWLNKKPRIWGNQNFEKLSINKQKYKIMLHKNEWKELRQKILERDNFKCHCCKSKYNLHVHHLLYVGDKPWKTPDRFLITLCEDCHRKVHSGQIKLDKDNIVFGEDLMKRCFIVKSLWDNDLCVPIKILRYQFQQEFEGDFIYPYLKMIREQGLITIKEGNIYATEKEIYRVTLARHKKLVI